MLGSVTLRREPCWDASWGGEGREWFLRALELLQPRLRTLKDLSGPARAYFRDDYPLDPAAVGKFWKDPLLAELLPALANDLAQLPQFDAAEAEKAPSATSIPVTSIMLPICAPPDGASHNEKRIAHISLTAVEPRTSCPRYVTVDDGAGPLPNETCT